MPKDLKKFVNPKFTRTVDLTQLRRLLERHADKLDGLDLALLEPEADHARAREAVQAFFAGPEDSYPEGLVADLHRIAELGSRSGLELILEQAARLQIPLSVTVRKDGEEKNEDPKHIALRVFLDHPRIFDAASDMAMYRSRPSLAEFVGAEEGVEAVIDDEAMSAFESAAKEMFEEDLRGTYCRVGCYDDEDEVVLIVTHGAQITTTPVVEGDDEGIISYRGTEHGVLAYSPLTGRLKVGGVAKARRPDLAEVFADTVLKRPGFFAGRDAQLLYTLEPVHARGFGFRFTHDFDPGIRRVQITEVQVDRLGVDPKSGDTRVFYSFVARDGRDNALARLGEMMGQRPLSSDWQIGHISIRVEFETGEKRGKKVPVKIKPPAQAMFRRQQHEGRIMTLLRRNGLLHDRDAGTSALAAE